MYALTVINNGMEKSFAAPRKKIIKQMLAAILSDFPETIWRMTDEQGSWADSSADAHRFIIRQPSQAELIWQELPK